MHIRNDKAKGTQLKETTTIAARHMGRLR